MKRDRKGKSIVTSDQLIDFLDKSDERGHTIKQLSDKFGVTKNEVRKQLAKRYDDWNIRHSTIDGNSYCVHAKHNNGRVLEQS